MKSLYVLTLLTFSLMAAENILTMGYRTTAKPPLIAAAPDNSGLYLDLYTEAARRIGFSLKIERLPKKRILLKLEDGTIDFYPVFVFSKERAKYTHFIETGLHDQNVAITLDNIPPISSFEDLDSMLFLQPLGNANYLEDVDNTSIRILNVAESDIGRIVSLLLLGHGDISIYQKSNVQYYLRKCGITNIRIHPDLLPDKVNLPLGFSKESPLYNSIPNPSYSEDLPMSPDNFPVRLEPNCTAFKLQEVLKEMAQDGFIDSLYIRYYGDTH